MIIVHNVNLLEKILAVVIVYQVIKKILVPWIVFQQVFDYNFKYIELQKNILIKMKKQKECDKNCNGCLYSSYECDQCA